MSTTLTTPTTTTTQVIEAVLDPRVRVTRDHWREPVNLLKGPRFGDYQVRHPDFLDPVAGTAVWFDQTGGVEIPWDDDPAHMARNMGWLGRTGVDPEDTDVLGLDHNNQPLSWVQIRTIMGGHFTWLGL